MYGCACLQWLEKPAFSPHPWVCMLVNVRRPAVPREKPRAGCCRRALRMTSRVPEKPGDLTPERLKSGRSEERLGLKQVPSVHPTAASKGHVLPGSCEHRSQYLKLRPLLKPTLEGQGLSHLVSEKLREHFLAVFILVSPFFLTPEHPLIAPVPGCFFLKERDCGGQKGGAPVTGRGRSDGRVAQ